MNTIETSLSIHTLQVLSSCSLLNCSSRDRPTTTKTSVKFSFYFTFHLKIKRVGASLVAQWWRICLPMQETQVQSLIQEDPTHCGATKPMQRSCWACALEPGSRSCWAHALRCWSLCALGPVRCNRSCHNEKPVHCNQEQPPCTATRESLHRNKDPAQPKIIHK